MNNKFSALFTDLYSLTMAQGYWKNSMNQHAVFEYFFRNQPFNGGFSVFAGLETLVNLLEDFNFSEEDLLYLSSLGILVLKVFWYLLNLSCANLKSSLSIIGSCCPSASKYLLLSSIEYLTLPI